MVGRMTCAKVAVEGRDTPENFGFPFDVKSQS